MKWADLAPSRHFFDRAAAERGVRECVRAAAGQPREDRSKVERFVTRALVACFGEWASGWRWTVGECGGGGPVRGYCCAAHHLFPATETNLDATGDRVFAALIDWREFLEEVESCFQTVEVGDLASATERAAGGLLTHVLSRTQCEDAWHETFQEVLRWFLELRGADIDAVTNVVDGVIAGRFSSWTEPSKEEIQNACSSIGAAVRDAARPTDVLAGWLTLREEPATLPEPRRNHRALDDPHRRYIETHDRARDLVRAARLSAALDAARALASRGEALTFEKFAEIQSLVLGEAAMFRTGPAYAKEGREMYSLASDTAVRFSRALAEATEGGAPLAWRAARLYLDVLFFHPFVDGNARAARLAMDYLLTREGHGLHAAAPLFKTPFAWGPEVLRNAALAFHELIAPLGPSGR